MRSLPREKKRVSDFDMTVQEGFLTLNIVDRVEIYAGAGSMSGHFCYTPFLTTGVEAQIDPSFVWEVGARTLLLYWRDTIFGVDVKFFSR